MKISRSWLQDWFEKPLPSAHELAESLTMSGLEVEGSAAPEYDFSDVQISRIEDLQALPGKNMYCRLHGGAEVVCAAPGLRIGMRVAWACPGAVLGQRRIAVAQRAGRTSQGMLCSALELDLAADGERLLELPEDAPLASRLEDYLSADDKWLSLDVTPNRGDCFGVRGIARELSAAGWGHFQQPVGVAAAAVVDPSIARWPVQVADPVACPRYLAVSVRGIDPTVRSPLWLTERLRQAGIRPLRPAVDVTNYLLLEQGQPLHAFDIRGLQGTLQVRWAKAGENLQLLDGRCAKLSAADLLIADSEGPLALAGIMGGAGSAVREDSGDLLLEGAFFHPSAIAGRARYHGLQTDASLRFERGVDPDLPLLSLRRAADLLCHIAGGTVGEIGGFEAPEQLPKRPLLHLRTAYLQRLIGHRLPTDWVVQRLRWLGMEIQATTEEGWQLRPPSWRFDITREVDLVEELLRLYGYHNLSPCRPQHHLQMHTETPRQKRLQILRGDLVAAGYQETIAYSFISAARHQRFSGAPARRLRNPLSAEMAVMRTTLWPGLVAAMAHNMKRQRRRMRLFEIGQCFSPAGEQSLYLGAALTGFSVPLGWAAESQRRVDFFDLKGDVDRFFAAMDMPSPRYRIGHHPALHPGQCAELLTADGRSIGWLGALHPAVALQCELDQECLLLELRLTDWLDEVRPMSYQVPPKNPAIRRDLSLVVDDSVSFGAVTEALLEAAPKALKGLYLFDVYRDKKRLEGQKSFAYRLILQDNSRTLNDDEADRIIAVLLQHIEREVGATLRV